MRFRAVWIAPLVVVFGLSIAIAYLGREERQSVSIDGPSGPGAATVEARNDDDAAPASAEETSIETVFQDQAQDAPASLSVREPQQGAQEAIPEQPFPPPMTQAPQDLELLPPIPEFAEAVRDFASQADDAPWSEPTEAHILGQISQATGLGAGDLQVDCGTTMCRVQLSNPVSMLNPRYNSLNELVDTFGLETLCLWATPDSNGNPINLVYLRRGGTSTTQSEAR